MLPLFLASSSPYRRELLERLRLPFVCTSPDIDESHHPRVRHNAGKAPGTGKSQSLGSEVPRPSDHRLGSGGGAGRADSRQAAHLRARLEQLSASSGKCELPDRAGAVQQPDRAVPGRLCAVYCPHAGTDQRAASAATCARAAVRLRRQLQGRRLGRQPVQPRKARTPPA